MFYKNKRRRFTHGFVLCNVWTVSFYSLPDAARILKVSPARLRYWERTELVSPQFDGEQKPRFGFADLVSVRGVLSLLEQGVSLHRIRRQVEAVREHLPDLDDPVRSLRVWLEGSDRIVVRHEGALLEPSGQTVLDFAGVGRDPKPKVAQFDPHSEIELTVSEEAEALFAKGCDLDSDPATLSQAIECYLLGLELAPDFADCHCNLGAVYYNRGERITARGYFEACLKLDSNHLEANFNLGNLLEEVGEDDGALHHYRRALAADPLYPDLHINLALLFEKLLRPAQARKHWKQYLSVDSSGAWSDIAKMRLSKTQDDQQEG